MFELVGPTVQRPDRNLDRAIDNLRCPRAKEVLERGLPQSQKLTRLACVLLDASKTMTNSMLPWVEVNFWVRSNVINNITKFHMLLAARGSLGAYYIE